MAKFIEEITNHKAKFFGFIFTLCFAVIVTGVFVFHGNKASVFIDLFKKYAETILGATITVLGVVTGKHIAKD